MISGRTLFSFAMSSIIILFSCHGVNYNDKKSDSDNWHDDLTNEEIVDWTEIIADGSADNEDLQTVSISWECPIKKSDWSIEYSYTGNDGDWTILTSELVEENANKTSTDNITIYKTDISTGNSTNYRYRFSHNPVLTDLQYIVYYKIIMTDSRDKSYDNIVPYVVFPQGKTLRVTVSSECESSMPSDIYATWDRTTPIFNQVRTSMIPSNSVEKILTGVSSISFWIETDFSSSGLEDPVKHYSNSSYCKVTKLSTPNSIEGKTVDATLKLSFEDYPKELLSHNPAVFDYNDIVFTVDIIQ